VKALGFEIFIQMGFATARFLRSILPEWKLPLAAVPGRAVWAWTFAKDFVGAIGFSARRAALDWKADGRCPYISTLCFEYFAGKLLKLWELLSFIKAFFLYPRSLKS